MSQELATEEDNNPIKQFQGKVADRIRGDIGDLMPDEMLQEIVKETIQKELYRPDSSSNYNKTPWIETEIREAIGNRIKSEVQLEIERQEKIVKKAVVEAVKEAVPNAIAEIVLALIKGNTFSIENMIRDFMMNRGNY